MVKRLKKDLIHPETRVLTTRISVNTWQFIKKKAIEKGITMNVLINEIFNDYKKIFKNNVDKE